MPRNSDIGTCVCVLIRPGMMTLPAALIVCVAARFRVTTRPRSDRNDLAALDRDRSVLDHTPVFVHRHDGAADDENIRAIRRLAESVEIEQGSAEAIRRIRSENARLVVDVNWNVL